jgi:hypothetical protein
MGKIIVSASQLGNLIGLNKHKPLHTAFEALWKRTHPQSYYAALKRNNIISDEERMNMLHLDSTHTNITVPRSAWEARKQLSTLHKMMRRHRSDIAMEDKSFVKSSLKKLVYTTYGNAAESLLFSHVHQTYHPLMEGVHTVASEPLFTASGVPCYLCGKPDALTADGTHIVELKNRIHRLLCTGGCTPPMHEYLQCLAYLYLIPDAKNCRLIESITTRKQRMICHVSTVERDPALWNRVVLPRLTNMAIVVTMVIRDPKLQDVYMRGCRNALSFGTFMRSCVGKQDLY